MFFFCVGVFAQEVVPSEIPWLTDYEQALRAAEKEKKNVLLYFTGSDWCPPCRLLKKDLFDTETFSIASKGFILLYVDMPRKKGVITETQLAHNKELLSKFNERGVFPLVTILDPKGNPLKELAGYKGQGRVQEHLELMDSYQ
ncbi:MAG: thioredoxin family protein [Sediminicola sp.]